MDFEADRRRQINEFLAVVPESQRKTLIALQLELDMLREKMSPAEFMAECFRRIGENAENTSDLCGWLKHHMGEKPAIQALADR